jgi:hypothetical protein
MTSAHLSLAALQPPRHVQTEHYNVAMSQQRDELHSCDIESRRFDASHARMHRGQGRVHVQILQRRFRVTNSATHAHGRGVSRREEETIGR